MIRMTHRRGLAAAALWSLMALPLSAQIVAYHDVNSATHQANFDSLTLQGYRLKSLSVYGLGAPVYAAVWSKESGPEWVGFQDASPSQYQTLFDTLTAQGYRPEIVTATASGSDAFLAGTFVKDGLNFSAGHGMTQQQFSDACDAARDAGLMLTWAAVYGAAATPEYLAVFTQNVDNTSWWWSLDASSGNYQKRFNAFDKVDVRPHFVTLSSAGQYLAIWHDDHIGSWIAHSTQSSASYNANAQAYDLLGYYPMVTQAAGPSASAVFATIFVKTENIVQRVPTITGTAYGAMAGFDVYVLGVLRDYNIRAGSLAIAKDGRLAYARGYTLAEPGYPIAQPTSLFRIASCSKPLTGIAVQIATELPNPKLAAWQTVPLVFGLQSVFDPQLNSTTVDHLLGHLGGWVAGKNGLGFNPMFNDRNVASTLSIPLPVSKADVFNYMTNTQPLQFTPGTQSVYSNYGFSVLGQMLERVNSGLSFLTYEQIVMRDVFTPLGVTRPRIGSSLQSGRAPGEVAYHPDQPQVYSSVFNNTDWVASQYGGWNIENMDAHGGWVMATPDYARVLAAFDLPQNPLMSSGSVTNMWSNPAVPASIDPTLMRGWYLTVVPDQLGINRGVAWHNGALQGTAALVFRRSDGLSFALFLNGDLTMGPSTVADLNDIANTVTSWPKKDLFPSVGIPPFPRRYEGPLRIGGDGDTFDLKKNLRPLP